MGGWVDAWTGVKDDSNKGQECARAASDRGLCSSKRHVGTTSRLHLGHFWAHSGSTRSTMTVRTKTRIEWKKVATPHFLSVEKGFLFPFFLDGGVLDGGPVVKRVRRKENQKVGANLSPADPVRPPWVFGGPALYFLVVHWLLLLVASTVGESSAPPGLSFFLGPRAGRLWF